MLLRFLIPPLVAAAVASIGAGGGVFLARRGSFTRYLIPISGGILILVALFVLLPELAQTLGWLVTVALAVGGFVGLFLVDRVALSVCPSCDHHHHEEVRLEGFAAPLLIAVAVHAFVDGWGLVAARVGTPGAGNPLALAILIHKIPEGLTLGAVTRASFDSTGVALAWCVAVELATFAGGAAGLWLTPVGWVSYPLAVAAGTFLFLGAGALGLRTRTA